MAAAWFTFDPQGAADDTSAQLWLTLQSAPVPADSTRFDMIGTCPEG